MSYKKKKLANKSEILCSRLCFNHSLQNSNIICVTFNQIVNTKLHKVEHFLLPKNFLDQYNQC